MLELMYKFALSLDWLAGWFVRKHDSRWDDARDYFRRGGTTQSPERGSHDAPVDAKPEGDTAAEKVSGEEPAVRWIALALAV